MSFLSHRRQGHRSSRRLSRGLSLTELLVAMLISLFLIGGMLAAFLATKQVSQRKARLELALEAFRYGSFAVGRMVRQAASVNSTSTGNSLSLLMPQGSDNCAGNSVTASAGETNVLAVRNEALVCTAGGASPQTLIEGVTALVVTYGIDSNADKRVADSEYVASPADWSKVTSIKVTMTLSTDTGSSGLEQSFVATLRKKALEVAYNAPTP